jgi:hypothetical protein
LNNKSILNVLDHSDDRAGLLLLLGIMNSRLLSLYYKHHAVKSSRKIFPKVVIRNLREFPFPVEPDVRISGRIVGLAQQMLDLHKRLPHARTDHERTALARQIEHTDAEIDRLVYELYGLTEEETALVEGAMA